MSAVETGVVRVIEALTACCVVGCVLAVAAGQVWWALVLACLAFVCHEICAELEP